MMMFAMAFPAVLGGMLLSNKVAGETRLYWQRLRQLPKGGDAVAVLSDQKKVGFPTSSQADTPGQS
jgi:hypothetical protein